MTTESEVQSAHARQLRLESGSQALLSYDSLHPSLSQLPAEAYRQLLIVSPRSPATVERLVRDAGGDLSTVGHIPLASMDHTYDGPLWTTKSIEPSDLTGLSMQYTRALQSLEEGHGWVLFDDFSTLLVYAETDRVVRFLNHLTQRTSEAGVRGIFAVVRDTVDDQTYAALRRVVDAEIDLR